MSIEKGFQQLKRLFKEEQKRSRKKDISSNLNRGIMMNPLTLQEDENKTSRENGRINQNVLWT